VKGAGGADPIKGGCEGNEFRLRRQPGRALNPRFQHDQPQAGLGDEAEHVKE